MFKKMNLLYKLLIIIFALGVISFNAEAATQGGYGSGSGGPGAHWGYTGEGGPEHWGDISPEFSVCKTGMAQSPIDISSTVKSDLGNIEFDYRSTPLKVLNNGYTIQANYTSDSFIKAGDKTYKLLQFHFHSPSENTRLGKHYSMEAHLVHKNGQGQLAVVGVFIKKGAHNPFIQTIWDNIPGEVNRENVVNHTGINAAQLLPKNGSYYHFDGSLTTPPCSEGVNWNVLKTPIEASEAQINKFLSIVGPDARPVQPLHGRGVIEVNTGNIVFTQIASTHTAQGNKGDRQTAAAVHGQPSAHGSGSSGEYGGSGGHSSVQAVPLELADRHTMELLKSDWLKVAEEEHLTVKEERLGAFFWTIMVILAAFLGAGLYVFAGGVFKRTSVCTKLSLSYGFLVAFAMVLGISAFIYMNRTVETGELEASYLGLNMMASEMAVAQKNFLLHGIKNREYGEKQVKVVLDLTKKFKENFASIRKNHHLEKEEINRIDEMKTMVKKYGEDFEKITKAYHEIEEGKENMDMAAEQTEEALKKMASHHQAVLTQLETEGSDHEGIKYQTLLVEHLAKMEVHILKASHAELEFLLDKNARHVGIMERELGMALGYARALEEKLRTSEEKAMTQKFEDELEKFIHELKAVIKDEAEIEKDTSEMNEMIHKLEAISSYLSHLQWARVKGMEREADIAIIILNVVALLVGILFASFISKAIKTPILEGVEFAKAMSSGDFTQRVKVTSGDEIGELGNALNKMAEDLSHLVKDITENANKLAGASEELSTVSTQLAGNSEEMAQQSQTVAGTTEQMSTNISTMASAAEEMSVNVQGISSAAEQTSTNINTIASAIEEMSTSINDVAQNAQEAANVSNNATDKARNAGETMKTLADAAQEIGQVIEDIKRIAEQTNLLALNATIEAASAGEAGRGFAVVANEVKELANQSAHAAENITARIAGVQKSTGDAVSAIEEITAVINNINGLQANITASVNQQTSAANEVSKNVSEAAKGSNSIASSIAEVSKGSNEVSKNASEAAKGANEVASNIQGVNTAAGDTSSGVNQINTSAGDLSKMAADLQNMVEKFKVAA